MVLLTGCSSLTGKSLLAKLIAAGIHVRCYDFFKPKELPSDIECFAGLLANDANLKAALTGVRAVIHCMDIKRPDARGRRFMKKLNVQGTANILSAAQAVGVSKFIFVSSHSVFGKKSRFAPLLFGSPYKPATAYGRDKLKAEAACRAFAKQTGMKITIMRPAAQVCPSIKDPAVLSSLLMCLGMGNENRMYAAGGSARYQLLHTEDFAKATLLALSSNASAGQTYNVAASDTPYRKDELLELQRRLGIKFNVKVISLIRLKFYRALLSCVGAHLFKGEHFWFLAGKDLLSCNKIKEHLGWQPKYSNTDILEETFRWYIKDKLKVQDYK